MERPDCDCTLATDSGRERAPSLHQEHCAVSKWWWAQCVPIMCSVPSCKRVEHVDPAHPNYTVFKALSEPRRVKCSHCAIKEFA